MSKLINCKIIEADIRYFPDFRRSIMEIIFHNELGTGCIQFKPSELFIFKILEKEHLKDFVGSFFRIEIDENGKFKRIYHLIDNYTYMDYEGNLI